MGEKTLIASIVQSNQGIINVEEGVKLSQSILNVICVLVVQNILFWVVIYGITEEVELIKISSQELVKMIHVHDFKLILDNLSATSSFHFVELKISQLWAINQSQALVVFILKANIKNVINIFFIKNNFKIYIT